MILRKVGRSLARDRGFESISLQQRVIQTGSSQQISTYLTSATSSGRTVRSIGPILCVDPKLKGPSPLWHVLQYGRAVARFRHQVAASRVAGPLTLTSSVVLMNRALHGAGRHARSLLDGEIAMPDDRSAAICRTPSERFSRY
jgi:hypothetical protein